MKRIFIAFAALLSVSFLGITLLIGTAIFFTAIVLPQLSLAGWCCFMSPQLSAAQPF